MQIRYLAVLFLIICMKQIWILDWFMISLNMYTTLGFFWHDSSYISICLYNQFQDNIIFLVHILLIVPLLEETTYKETILLESEEIIPLYYMHSDICSRFISSTTLYYVTHSEKKIELFCSTFYVKIILPSFILSSLLLYFTSLEKQNTNLR